MTPEEAIKIYKKVRVLPTQCHIGWLRENFNPILKAKNARMNINWACGNCIKSNMNMLMGWLNEQENAKTES